MEPKDIFSQRANDLYIDSGLSLKKLNKETGVTYSQLSKYHRGEAEPSLTNLCRLADYYGVSIDWLCGRPGAPQTYKSTISHAAAALGIKENAAACIHEFESRVVLDAVFQSEYFWEALREISGILSIAAFDVPYFSGEINGKEVKSPSDFAIKALRHEAARNIDLLIDSMIDRYSPQDSREASGIDHETTKNGKRRKKRV